METESGIEVRPRLLGRLAAARAQTDELFRLVRPEALWDRPIPERHRIIFYIGHLEAMDWNLMGRHIFGFDPFEESFDRLFAFGIDPVDADLPNDQPSDWPALEKILRYNQRVRQALDAALEAASFSDPRHPYLHNGLILQVALEHRLMHAETLAYMLHQLPLHRKVAQPILPAPATPPVRPGMVDIPPGTATLGLPRTTNGAFGWDNEFEAHAVAVPGFAIDVYNVTNGEYLEFVRQGGYEHRTLWTDADWEWKARQGIQHPQCWTRRGDRWYYRTMFAELPLPFDWPAYVSHAEAEAYARWVGKTLPTEAQLHRAAYGTPDGSERVYPWGHQPPQPCHANCDFRRWDPTPVGAHPSGKSAFGVADLVGNGWEWTSTLFGPFPGFQPFPLYPGYSANFFDDKHYVLKGGSARTAVCLVRRSFRNWFQPHYPYVYAALRCVVN